MFRHEIRRRRMGLQHSLLPLAILAVGAGTGSAPAQLLGPEFQVNSYTTGSQASGKVAADRTGKFVVVWQSVGQDGDGYGAFGQRFDADDLPLGGEFQVNEYTTVSQFWPRTAMDGSGRFVVTWSNSFSRVRTVSARRYDAAGLPLAGEFQVNNYTSASGVRAVGVTADVAGNFVVIWNYTGLDMLSLNGGTGQRFDAGGERVGAEFPVGDSYIFGYGPGGGDSVATSGPGEFVVGLVNDTGGYPGPDYLSPAAQRFDAAGAVGSRIEVDTPAIMVAERGVQVASAGAGDFVVAWTAFPYSAAGQPRDIFARRLGASGVALGDVFLVNSYTPANQGSPSVAADRKGNFLVVWQSPDQDGSGNGIFGQRFAADGSPIGGEFQVNSYTTGAQSSPSVAAGNVGDFIVAWQSDDQDGSGAGVFARRIRSSIFWGGFELGNPCGWSTVVGGGCP